MDPSKFTSLQPGAIHQNLDTQVNLILVRIY